MTPEEINNSPILKMAKSLVKKKYHWISDVKFPEDKDPYEYSKLMFVRVYIDPIEFAKVYNVELKTFVMKWANDEVFGAYSSLCTIVNGECPNEVKELERNIEREINLPFKYNTVPNHFYEIMVGRRFATTSFVTFTEAI